MNLPDSVDPERLRRLIQIAREEDLGERGDITSQIAALSGETRARLVAREPCVVAGLAILPAILGAYDKKLALCDDALPDGRRCEAAGEALGEIRGPGASLLACERVLLNFVQRLCGIATATRAMVDAVAGTGARIYDTRKTVPGWRDLDKYAVRCGGGNSHRAGLHDAILIKDNHLAGVPIDRLAATVFEMLNRADSLSPAPAFVEVEADTPAQLEELFKITGIGVILLDNFSPERLRRAVARRDELGLGGEVELEASGGIGLSHVREIAETGVERISVGALTHSVRAVDVSVERIS